MGGTTHDRTALAAFQDGEERLVYARCQDRPDDPPFFLEDGAAHEIREWAKEHLECFMPKCADRRLTTVARTLRRDGFRHLAGAGNHSRESLFHQQAKALIVRWLTSSHSGVSAEAEVATASGERRADVMVTFPDGRQVAVEIQYSSLPTREWSERHESYLHQGITPVWLLGHLPPHLRAKTSVKGPNGEPEEAVHLSDLQRVMTAAGVPLLWISPIEEQVGASWVLTEHTSPYRLGPTAERAAELNGFQRPVTDRSKWAYFAADPINACRLTANGLITPTTAHVDADHARYRQAVARHEQEDRMRAEQARAATRERVARQQEVSERLRRTQPPLPSALLLPGVEVQYTSCVVCGTSLDPALSRIGRHVLC